VAAATRPASQRRAGRAGTARRVHTPERGQPLGCERRPTVANASTRTRSAVAASRRAGQGTGVRHSPSLSRGRRRTPIPARTPTAHMAVPRRTHSYAPHRARRVCRRYDGVGGPPGRPPERRASGRAASGSREQDERPASVASGTRRAAPADGPPRPVPSGEPAKNQWQPTTAATPQATTPTTRRGRPGHAPVQQHDQQRHEPDQWCTS